MLQDCTVLDSHTEAAEYLFFSIPPDILFRTKKMMASY